MTVQIARKRAGNKPIFAPVPVRAMGDHRLSLSMLRTLMAIAAHDRLDGNGQGCWSSQQRLGDLTGCSLSHVNEHIASLAALGYISVARRNDDKRRRVYRVIYTDEDLATLKRDATRQREPRWVDRAPDAAATGLDNASDGPEILPDAKDQVADIINGITRNIFRETEGYTSKRGIHSPEGAPPDGGGVRKAKVPVAPASAYPPTVGANLAQCERYLRSEPHPARAWLASWKRWLAAVAAEFEGDDSVSHGPRAQRLLEEITDALECIG